MARDFYQSTSGQADANGAWKVLEGIQVFVYIQGTNQLAAIYQDRIGVAQGPVPASAATGGPNPFVTGSTGSIQFFADSAVEYEIALVDTIAPARIPPDLPRMPWSALSAAPGGTPASFLQPGTVSEQTFMTSVLAMMIPIGGMFPYAGDGDPAGGRFLLAEGRLVNSVDYPALDAMIGGAAAPAKRHKYNLGVDPGNGKLKLPDKRSRASVGADDMGTAQGSAGRLPNSNRVSGQSGGEERHTLTAAESGVAAHGHAHNLANSNAGSHSHGGATAAANPVHAHVVVNFPAAPNAWGYQDVTLNQGAGTTVVFARIPVRAYGEATWNGNATQNADINHAHGITADGVHTHAITGGVTNHAGAPAASAHNVMQPYELDNWIIRVL